MRPPNSSLDLDRQELIGQLTKFGKTTCRVVSGSMQPLIAIGDSITVGLVPTTLRPFDIYIYAGFDRLICHVLLKQSAFGENGETQYIFGSLNQWEWDLPVKRSDILGRVESHHVSFWQRLKLTVAMIK